MYPRKRINYINNKELHTELTAYIMLVREAKNKGEPRPKIPEKIGAAVYQIATRLSSKSCFYGYPYREDMVSDGMLNFFKYIHNFDPEQPNAFAYVTKALFNGYIKRIGDEKKQDAIKIRNSRRMLVDGHGELQSDNEAQDYFLTQYEISMDKKRKTKNERKNGDGKSSASVNSTDGGSDAPF